MNIATPASLAGRAALALLLAPALALADTAIDETRPLSPGAEVRVENMKGEIAVSAWDRDEIHVGGTLGEGVEGLDIDGQGSRISITVRYPESGGWFGWGNSGGEPSRLEIRVPRQVELELEGVSADIRVRDTEGRTLDVETVSGDVDVDAAAGEASLATVSGDLKARLRGESLDVETVSGDLEVRGDGVARIEAESVSGDVDIETRRIDQLEGSTVSGDFDLAAEAGARSRIRIEALSGDIALRLLGQPSARLRASSFSGTIRSPVGSVQKSEYGPGQSLDARIGEGAADIELETFSGSITISATD